MVSLTNIINQVIPNANNAPAYQIIINGKDRTDDMQDRLIDLRLTDVSGFEADTLTITLSDHDGALTLPEADEKIQLAIGWSDTGVVDKGIFIIDEVEHSGTPDTITITARSAEFCGEFQQKKERVFHKTTLSKIIETIASNHGWKPLIDVSFNAINIEHLDQQGESDANLLQRLGTEYDAVATVKSNSLLFLPKGVAKTASGKDIPTMYLSRSVGDGHRFTRTRADQYTGVVALYHDTVKGKRTSVTVKRKTTKQTTKKPKTTTVKQVKTQEMLIGSKENIYTLPKTYSNAQTAKNACIAKWAELQRSLSSLSLNLAMGVPDLIPLQPVEVEGFKTEIDSLKWAVNSVEHSISSSGYTSSIQLECVQVDKDSFLIY